MSKSQNVNQARKFDLLQAKANLDKNQTHCGRFLEETAQLARFTSTKTLCGLPSTASTFSLLHNQYSKEYVSVSTVVVYLGVNGRTAVLLASLFRAYLLFTRQHNHHHFINEVSCVWKMKAVAKQYDEGF